MRGEFYVVTGGRFRTRDGGLVSVVVGSVCAGGRVFLHRLVSGTSSTVSGLCCGDLASPSINVGGNSFHVLLAHSGSGHLLAISSGNVNVAGRRLRRGLNAVTRSNSLSFGGSGGSRGVSVVNRFNINFCSTFVITSGIAIVSGTCNTSRT